MEPEGCQNPVQRGIRVLTPFKPHRLAIAHERPICRLTSWVMLSLRQLPLEQPIAASGCEEASRERGIARGAPSGVFPSDAAIAQAVARAEEKQIRQALDKARQAQQRWIYRSLGR